MGLAVAILVGLIVIAILWFVFSGYAAGKSSQEGALEDRPGGPGVETLRYRIPDRQDPAVLITALKEAGYSSALEEVRGDKYLAIACPTSRDRERAHIRAVIDQADTASLEGPKFDHGKVMFEDEQQ